MNFATKVNLIALLALAGLAGLYGTAAAAGTCVSNNPDEIPPFLTSKLDPNLLLIIDNSASMYDLAYIEKAAYCFDGIDGSDITSVESYDPAADYAGYFERDAWYAYDTTTNKFVVKPDGDALTACGSATHIKRVGLANHICLTLDVSGNFVSLLTRGNFLNWAAASKMDIEKKILTGGKYIADDQNLVLESRGCLERRFIKQTQFDDGFYLTLGVRPPTLTEREETAGSATRIELYQVTADGYNHKACEDAIAEMDTTDGTPASLGKIKGYVEECMGYSGTGGQSLENASNSAFNHAVQNCWYESKQEEWPPGAGPINRVKQDCEKVYGYISPPAISWDHSGYVCYGNSYINEGFVGVCWDSGICKPMLCNDPSVLPLGPKQRCDDVDGIYLQECSGNVNPQGKCSSSWENVLECDGGVLSTNDWYDDDYWARVDTPDSLDTCIEVGLKAFCDSMKIPEVVDPSDQVTGTGDDSGTLWNLPAMLVDSGAVWQLGEPLVVMAGRLALAASPSGLLQEFASELRIGAMTFNWDGAKTECDATDSYITYQCDEPDIRDGGTVITAIGKGETHTDKLVSDVNDIVADAWTPLGEAIFNAIGYYTQRDDLRLDPLDFDISVDDNPITGWCQLNNIMLITDGASTADQATEMANFLGTNFKPCPALHGSTSLIELAEFARINALGGDPAITLGGDFAYPAVDEKYRTISTHIVAAGRFREEGIDQCNPNVLLADAAMVGGTTLYQADDLGDLENQLRQAFRNIRAGAAAGSAASVIAATRSGEGAVYQAIFWPEKVDDFNNTITVNWTGEVQALFVDERGRLFEDTNGNRIMDPYAEEDPDRQVTIYYDPEFQYSMACYGSINETGHCDGDNAEIADVKYLWTASGWLNNLSDLDLGSNRLDSNLLASSGKRNIFTWYDLNNDGKVGAGEVLAFEADTIAAAGAGVYASLNVDTTDDAEARALINWLRGVDQAGLRSRAHNGKTWRLGDVVHSTPTVVSRPIEGYHFLYRDSSYARFANRHNKRRTMIYFGSNDGMLHAVNGGFYNSAQSKFCLTTNCEDENTALALGAEVWAYVPYNLWPYLNCLADPGYGHKYYVDQTPRIFDVQIFTPEPECADSLLDPKCVHPDGWGTILVGSMRFGGVKTEVNGRTFASSYFILDITNPEQPPVLLGEMIHDATSAEMGFTTAVPTVVPMVTRNAEGVTTHSEWYLVLGSGPTNLKGESTQVGRVAIISLKELINQTTAFRIPDAEGFTAGSETGSVKLEADHLNSIVSDLITVDYGLNYLANAVYFGTVSGAFGPGENDGWVGGGRLYRLVTEALDVNSKQIYTTPNDWYLSQLIETPGPITTAPASSWDGRNYWIYFGTGHLFNRKDYADTGTFHYYGIKEPHDGSAFTWGYVDRLAALAPNTTPGQRGLLQVDQITVTPQPPWDALLGCIDGTLNCLLDVTLDEVQVTEFQGLIDYIAGDGTKTGTDGWYRQFELPGERNLGQATVLGGLLTYTTYRPSADLCSAEGFSYLYALYYQTGTAWRRQVLRFLDDGTGTSEVAYRVSLGAGLAISPSLHVGAKEGATVFLQTSTGAIVAIEQPELPFTSYRSGREWWREIYRDMFLPEE